MHTSHGRYCRHCRNRISRRLRLCPICGAFNPKPVDYAVFAALSAACLYLLGRWL